MRSPYFIIMVAAVSLVSALVFLKSADNVTFVEPPAPVAGSKQEPAARGVAQEMDRLGIVRMPLRNQELTVSLLTEKRCTLGDIDAIRLDLKYSPASRLILTLEPLDKNAPLRGRAVQPITVEELMKPHQRIFSTNGYLSGTQLGVFLCNDSTGAGRCFGKEVLGINEVFSRHYRQGGVGKNYKTPDRIYYFQYVQMQSGSAAFLSTNKPTADAFDGLAAAAGGADAQAPAAYAQATLASLRSMPLTTDYRTVRAVFPYHDEAACPH